MADAETVVSTEEACDKMTKNGAKSEESLLIDAVKNGDIREVGRLASQWQMKIDAIDKNGMTALMHASYKGDDEIAEILITHGADVNRKSIEHEYTPLMFATLAGSKETARVLLEAGADPSAENKIHKTATMMGAFVGRHECVSLINNYIAKQDIDYYTRPQGLEKDPKLPPFLAEPLQQFVIIANLHPVNKHEEKG